MVQRPGLATQRVAPARPCVRRSTREARSRDLRWPDSGPWVLQRWQAWSFSGLEDGDEVETRRTPVHQRARERGGEEHHDGGPGVGLGVHDERDLVLLEIGRAA